MATFANLLQSLSGPEEAIVIPGGPTLSYEQLIKAVNDFSVQLGNLGLKNQDFVSISLPNGIEFAIAFLGVTGASLVAAPLNPNYKQSEFEFYIEDCKSKVVLVPKGSVSNQYAAVAAAQKFGAAVGEVYWAGDRLNIDLIKGSIGPKQEVTPPKPSDIAFVLHTSGTTGRPKAVPLTHANMEATVNNITRTYHLNAQDSSYLVMPLFHVHGLLAGFLTPLGTRGRVIIPSKFSAGQFWSDFTKYKANWYTAVPTIHQILLSTKLPSPIPEIRFIRSCSSSLAPSTFEKLEKTFKAPVVEAYAMTEACHQMTSNDLPPGKRKPGTVGVGQGVEVVILDDKSNILPQGKEGEVSVRGPNVTPGYLNNPKANAESFTNGYFRTGDQGKFDEDGLLVLTGRIKELINRGGEKISPIELDGILLSHPAVSEAVAFGAPNEKYGEEVNAVVVLKPGQKATEQELKDHVAQKVAAFKVPVRIVFTDVMPKTATGKIQRRIIAQKFAAPAPKAKL